MAQLRYNIVQENDSKSVRAYYFCYLPKDQDEIQEKLMQRGFTRVEDVTYYIYFYEIPVSDKISSLSNNFWIRSMRKSPSEEDRWLVDIVQVADDEKDKGHFKIRTYRFDSFDRCKRFLLEQNYEGVEDIFDLAAIASFKSRIIKYTNPDQIECSVSESDFNYGRHYMHGTIKIPLSHNESLVEQLFSELNVHPGRSAVMEKLRLDSPMRYEAIDGDHLFPGDTTMFYKPYERRVAHDLLEYSQVWAPIMLNLPKNSNVYID